MRHFSAPPSSRLDVLIVGAGPAGLGCAVALKACGVENLAILDRRAKALVRLRDRPGSRWLYGRTIDDPVGEPYEVDGLAKAPSSLVCIGPGLDPAVIRLLVEEILGVPVA